jgi:hypothetical protein
LFGLEQRTKRSEPRMRAKQLLLDGRLRGCERGFVVRMVRHLFDVLDVI